MKFRNKLLVPPVMALALGMCASLSAFGASMPASGPKLASSEDGALPKGAEHLKPYMIAAGSLDNSTYLSCIRSKLKFPAGTHAVTNVQRALDCQTAKN